MDFLPMPHHVTHGEGSFALGWRTPINLVDTQPSALLYAQMLRQAVEEFTGLRLRLLRGCAHSGEITLTQDSSLPGDTYRLSVTSEGVTVRPANTSWSISTTMVPVASRKLYLSSLPAS